MLVRVASLLLIWYSEPTPAHAFRETGPGVAWFTRSATPSQTAPGPRSSGPSFSVKQNVVSTVRVIRSFSPLIYRIRRFCAGWEGSLRPVRRTCARQLLLYLFHAFFSHPCRCCWSLRVCRVNLSVRRVLLKQVRRRVRPLPSPFFTL
jgi:hypothetical protein